MTASFNTTELVNDQVLVSGTDVNGVTMSEVLDGSQWAEVNAHAEFSQATEDFDAAVEEFFAPLMEAAEAVQSKLNKPDDSLGYVVLEEATEGIAPTAGKLVKLSRDSMILRLIEADAFNRLVWVNGQLHITKG